MRKKSLLSKTLAILFWPARFLSTRMRLSIGLALGVFSLLLLSQFFNIIPSRNDVQMRTRGLQTETLALTGTALATATRDISGFQQMLQNAVDRDPDAARVRARPDSVEILRSAWPRRPAPVRNATQIQLPMTAGVRENGRPWRSAC